MLETIRNKLHELEQQKEQTVAQLNAICGAEQILRELLAEAEAESEKGDKPDA